MELGERTNIYYSVPNSMSNNLILLYLPSHSERKHGDHNYYVDKNVTRHRRARIFFPKTAASASPAASFSEIECYGLDGRRRCTQYLITVAARRLLYGRRVKDARRSLVRTPSWPSIVLCFERASQVAILLVFSFPLVRSLGACVNKQ